MMVLEDKPKDAPSYVDLTKGTISRDIFVSPDIYQNELERVFTRSWLFIGHESQIPNPNDYFVSRMGEESVIMTRDRQGEIHVLLNTCMHRGMKVCRYDEGNTPVFSCPYHGWSYSTDGNLISVPGELIGVPQFATAYHGELKKEEWGLISVPRVHNYRGSIWACWDTEAPDFIEYLGDMHVFLDTVFESIDGDPAGVEVFGGVQKWVMPCNWKFASENFIGDYYHGRTTHRSTDLPGGIRMRRSGRVRQLLTDADPTGGYHFAFPQGHGTKGHPPELWDQAMPYMEDDYADMPEVGAYLRESQERRTKLLGGRGSSDSGGNALSIFPNMSALGYCVAVWHPAGPLETEAWRFYVVDKKAPPALKELWRQYRIAYSGATGMVEQDDMENWNYASEASQGTIARRYAYHYAMGLGHEVRSERIPGASISRVQSSEQNQRAMYRRWSQLMDAKNWDEIRIQDAETQ